LATYGERLREDRMNNDCHRGVRDLLEGLAPTRVVEFGSLDVNGNARDLLGDAEYIGIDLRNGPNVMVAADAATFTPPWSPDLVLCLNVLEHTPNFLAIVANAWRILAPGGTFVLVNPDTTWERHGSSGLPLQVGEWYQAFTVDETPALMSRFENVVIGHHDQLIFARGEKSLDAPEGIVDDEMARTADRRLNLGCGGYPLAYWRNLDQNPAFCTDIVGDAMEYLQSCENGEYDEIYAGHFIEHLERRDAILLIRECYRVLTPGGKLGIVVPDMREVFTRYVARAIDVVQYPLGTFWPVSDLDAVAAMFVYSTVQESPHLWMWDMEGLARQLALAGFVALREIDRHRDIRLGSPAWYQCGFDGRKPLEEAEPSALFVEALKVEAKFAEAIGALARVEEQ